MRPERAGEGGGHCLAATIKVSLAIRPLPGADGIHIPATHVSRPPATPQSVVAFVSARCTSTESSALRARSISTDFSTPRATPWVLRSRTATSYVETGGFRGPPWPGDDDAVARSRATGASAIRGCLRSDPERPLDRPSGPTRDQFLTGWQLIRPGRGALQAAGRSGTARDGVPAFPNLGSIPGVSVGCAG